MLAKEIKERYQTVHEVWTNLNKLSDKMSISGVSPAPSKLEPRNWLRVSAALIVLAALVITVVYFNRPGPISGEEGPIDSIAVLPFKNLSGDEDSDILCRGIPETISSKLTRLSQLSVKPSSNLQRYKGKDVDPQIVSNEQGVRAVLTGSVLLRGDTLVVRVELVDGQENTVIWSQPYRVEFGDIFAVEEDTARQVVEALRLELTSEEVESLAQSGTQNPEAYQDFMSGQHHSLDRSDWKTAISYYESAVSKDPKYQEAYATLSQVCFLYALQQTQSKSDFARAREYAERGIAIDGSTAVSHELKAIVLWSWARNWHEAEKEYERVAELGSNLIESRYIMFLKYMGLQEEYLAEIERQLDRSDPLSEGQQRIFGWHFLTHGDWDRAIEQAKKARALNPQNTSNYSILQKAYEEKGMEKEAFEARLQALKLGNASEERIAALQKAFEESGLEGVKRFDPDPGESSRLIHRAAGFARLGQKEKAFEWLEKAWSWDLPLAGMEHTPANPDFDSLRDDPRFEEILRSKLNLPEEAIQRHLTPSGS
jgi:TolB-like protein/tetratricopeptide (TPR) repeat protein